MSGEVAIFIDSPTTANFIQEDGSVLAAFITAGASGKDGSPSTSPDLVLASPYVLSADDLGQVKVWNGLSDLTIEVPDGLGDGFTCKAITTGTGAIIFEATGSAFIAAPSGLSLTTQYGVAELVPFGTDQYALNLGGGGGGGGSASGTLDFSDPSESGLIGH